MNGLCECGNETTTYTCDWCGEPVCADCQTEIEVAGRVVRTHLTDCAELAKNNPDHFQDEPEEEVYCNCGKELSKAEAEEVEGGLYCKECAPETDEPILATNYTAPFDGCHDTIQTGLSPDECPAVRGNPCVPEICFSCIGSEGDSRKEPEESFPVPVVAMQEVVNFTPVAFTIERKAFLGALKLAKKATTKNPVIPILANVQLRVENGTIHLTATDLEVGLTVKIPALKVMSPGAFTAPISQLISLLGTFADGEVDITSGPNNILAVCGATQKGKLFGLPATEFPVLPTITDPILTVNAPSHTLKEIIANLSVFISRDPSRVAITGMLVESWNGEAPGMAFVSTDGARLAMVTRAFPNGSNPPAMRAILSPRALTLITAISKTAATVKLTFTERQVFAETETVKVNANFISGNFPEYKAVFQKSPFMVSVYRLPLLDGLRQSLTFANDRYDLLKVSLTEAGEMTLQIDNPGIGQFVKTIDCRSTFNGEVGLNPFYLCDVLRRIEAEKVEIGLKDAISGVYFRAFTGNGNEDDGYRFVVMPRKL